MFIRSRRICGALLLGLATLSGCASSRPRPAYAKLEAGLAENQRLEDDAFGRLVFTLSPRRIRQSMNYKFVVRDQLGREWLFKAGIAAGEDGAVAVYRAFKAFGLDTPEVHRKTFVVNGKEISGSLQKMIPVAGQLRPWEIEYSRFAPATLDYVAKNFVLSWLLLNHQVHSGQFLVTRLDPLEIVRIDNGIDWFLMDSDRFAADYLSPFLLRAPDGGYAGFWRAYLYRRLPANPLILPALGRRFEANAFDLDVPGLLAWARFVSEFPDADYERLFAAGEKNGFAHFSNANEGGRWLRAPFSVHADPAAFLPELLRRKQRVVPELTRMLTELARLRGDAPPADSGARVEDTADGVLRRLADANAALRSDLAKLGTAGALRQEELAVPMSFPVQQALFPVLWNYDLPGTDGRVAVIDAVIERVAALRRPMKNPLEIRAADTALENLRALRADPDRAGSEDVLNLNLFFEPGWIKGLRNRKQP